MYQVSEEDERQIREHQEKMKHWFEGWFNGTVSENSLDNYAKFIHEDWKLVNKQIPKQIVDKSTFLEVWPTIYGQHKDKNYREEREVHFIKKLSDEYFMVLLTEIRYIDDEIKKRPITSIYKKDLDTGQFQVIHVHE